MIALAMVSAGALGNLIDRALLGQVTDFFEFAFVEFPVFNVADMAIVVRRGGARGSGSSSVRSLRRG